MTSVIQKWLHHCIRCSTCKYVFRDYSPSCPSGEYYRFESYWASGRLWLARGLETGELGWSDELLELLFTCTTCGSCEEQCQAPQAQSIVKIIEELRERYVSEIGPLPKHEAFADNVAEHHNPYGNNHHARTMVAMHGLPDKADTVFFIGCTSNYRETSIRDAAVSVLKKADVDFTVVDEYCCGSPLVRTGQTQSVLELAKHNAAEFEACGCTRIITACAGCYRTLSTEYPEILGSFDLEVVHISQLIKDLIESGRLSIERELGGVFTYHDPCHLGRHGAVYDEPRVVMELLGLELSEMDLNRENAWCCGAGGGVRSAFRDMSTATAEKRIQQAQATGADNLVTCCPFCVNNLQRVAGEDMQVDDLVELVDRLSD